MAPPVLWQFRFSHFNEKARWALDWKGIAHLRRSLVPGLHIPRVLWLTGQKSVPVLTLDGQTIADSTRIIAALERTYPDAPLYPRDDAARARALALEEFFDEELGPYVRRALFHALLTDSAYCTAMFTTGTGAGTQWTYRTLFPAMRAVMKVDMGIDPARAEAARAKTSAALDRLEAELQPSGYLVGDRFTVADLTAAALLSPLINPPEYPYPLPGPLPAAAAALRASVAGRRGFQWAQQLYRRHRGRSAELAA